MTIYIIFLIFIFAAYFLINTFIEGEEKQTRYFLNIVFVAMFLLYSLRSSSVGRDLPGYAEAYATAATKSLGDFSYVYFENGYILLMQLCNLAHLSFQWFLTICNVLILLPIYIFIRKYSKNPFLSVIIYVCYMFFEFNLTGIRQAIASSIVLLAVIALLESKRFPLIKYIILVWIATQFHSAAYIAYFYIPFHFIKRWRTYVSTISFVSMILLFGRSYILTFIKNYFEKVSMNASAGLYIGLNFIFIVGLAVVFVFAIRNKENIKYEITLENNYADDILINSESIGSFGVMDIDDIATKMFLLSISALLLFGSDNSVRSYMVLNQVVIVLLPNSLEWVFNENSRLIARLLMITFFVAFFFTNTLIPNNFDIVPYKFFWQ